MARRSSARLRNKNLSTPQPLRRVSLSHDAVNQPPKTVPAKLGPVREEDNTPGSFPESPMSVTPTQPAKRVRKMVSSDKSTPKQAAHLQPADEEMHPQRHHQTAPDASAEARWLGFQHMPSATEPPNRGKAAPSLNTPSKLPKVPATAFASPRFEFTFRRENSLELSPQAKKLMLEKREEAAAIRDQMLAAGEAESKPQNPLGNNMARPKGRFSDAHRAAFSKMDSIASHASAYRKESMSSTERKSTVKLALEELAHRRSGGLKRSPSKAQLDEPTHTPTKLGADNAIRAFDFSTLPASVSERGGVRIATAETCASPSKRVKLSSNDHRALSKSPTANDTERMVEKSEDLPLTNHKSDVSSKSSQKAVTRGISVTRRCTSSIPASKLTGYSNTRSETETHELKSALFQPPPSKLGSCSGSQRDAGYGSMLDPSLARTPRKHVSAQTVQGGANSAVGKSPGEPLLSKSPLKLVVTKLQDLTPLVSSRTTEPLLSKSPLKTAKFEGLTAAESSNEDNPACALLSRSPAKISLHNDSSVPPREESASKIPRCGLEGRFKLLRSTPVKSILRSPQRLYSNDPAKVAAGTHFATPPPKFAFGSIKVQPLEKQLSSTAPVQKHVDFTSSTKDRDDASSSQSSLTAHSEGKAMTASQEQATMPLPVSPSTAVLYPSLPSPDVRLTPSPEKRRQTAAPGDFTFRMGDGITFGPSPHAKTQQSSLDAKPPTIRHVSADSSVPPPATGSKKRKFDFENAEFSNGRDDSVQVQGSKKRKMLFENHQAAQHPAMPPSSGGNANATTLLAPTSEKENDPPQENKGEGPAKRARPNFAAPTAASTAASKQVSGHRTQSVEQKPPKRPTLGVKPKGAPKSATVAKQERETKKTTISQKRLAMLAQPKKKI